MLRQTMEMMRNPNAMQQAMRSQDLAMSQIENLPGGFSALRRMYEEVSLSRSCFI
jgi:ubiquilin